MPNSNVSLVSQVSQYQTKRAAAAVIRAVIAAAPEELPEAVRVARLELLKTGAM